MRSAGYACILYYKNANIMREEPKLILILANNTEEGAL